MDTETDPFPIIEPWDEPNYPEVIYVVVSDARVVGEARAFRWSQTARDYIEIPIEVRA